MSVRTITIAVHFIIFIKVHTKVMFALRAIAISMKVFVATATHFHPSRTFLIICAFVCSYFRTGIIFFPVLLNKGLVLRLKVVLFCVGYLAFLYFWLLISLVIVCTLAFSGFLATTLGKVLFFDFRAVIVLSILFIDAVLAIWNETAFISSAYAKEIVSKRKGLFAGFAFSLWGIVVLSPE